MDIVESMPAGWREPLADELMKPYIASLGTFVAAERQTHTVYPPEGQVFTALELTPFAAVRVVILGQDPYHGPGQAHGLAFSVNHGIPIPPSLVNIYKELRSDLEMTPPKHGYLVGWAQQGVLLLNTVLTVRAGEANSHKGKGWEKLTDAIIQAIGKRDEHAVFVLWGSPAHKKAALIDEQRHTIIRSVHPSPLSARNGFFGSRPFSQVNAALEAHGQPPVDWAALS
jgi:uracil-DNA glycosylase